MQKLLSAQNHSTACITVTHPTVYRQTV